jgi:hypothetical protein
LLPDGFEDLGVEGSVLEEDRFSNAVEEDKLLGEDVVEPLESEEDSVWVEFSDVVEEKNSSNSWAVGFGFIEGRAELSASAAKEVAADSSSIPKVPSAL